MPKRSTDASSIPFQEARPCADCGSWCESGYFDMAIHDCAADEWTLLTMTVPAELAPPDWPPERIASP